MQVTQFREPAQADTPYGLTGILFGIDCDVEGNAMHPRILALLLVLFGKASWAQEDLLACVDPDVREGPSVSNGRDGGNPEPNRP